MNIQSNTGTGSVGGENPEEFGHYGVVRDRILRMVKDADEQGAAPSEYWAEEVAGFEYLFEASPLIIKRFREHCYHITGIHSYPYRSHHGDKNVGHTQRYNELKAIDTKGLFVPEAAVLGGFGHDVGAGLANIDTLKFYEVAIGLDKTGLLDTLQHGGAILEIGAGWGGFAYQMLKLYPKTRYIIVDLPHTMLFSAVYLRNALPNARLEMYGEEGFEEKLADGDFDIAFIPHYAVGSLKLPTLAFGVNMASFQEMTAAQVSEYARVLSSNECPAIYSLNRKHSPYNTELGDVKKELSRYYKCHPVHLLDTPYTMIGKKSKNKAKVKLADVAKKLKPGREDLNYTHLVGRL